MQQSYHDRQVEQFRKFMRWVKSEGGVEGPTQLRTMLQTSQVGRMDWLKAHATGQILEVGTNWGLVLAWVNGHVGVDISPMNIELAKLLDTSREFHIGDALSLPFPDQSFDTVMLPEVLEHLDFPDGVDRALAEARRVTRRVILITLPDGATDTEDATNFKHAWLADKTSVQHIVDVLERTSMDCWHGRRDYGGGHSFVLIRAMEVRNA